MDGELRQPVSFAGNGKGAKAGPNNSKTLCHALKNLQTLMEMKRSAAHIVTGNYIS